jgi:hypothetical protein
MLAELLLDVARAQGLLRRPDLAVAPSPEILVTPTPGDHAVNKILTALHEVKIQGENQFCASVQVNSSCPRALRKQLPRERTADVFYWNFDDEAGLVRTGASCAGF